MGELLQSCVVRALGPAHVERLVDGEDVAPLERAGSGDAQQRSERPQVLGQRVALDATGGEGGARDDGYLVQDDGGVFDEARVW